MVQGTTSNGWKVLVGENPPGPGVSTPPFLLLWGDAPVAIAKAAHKTGREAVRQGTDAMAFLKELFFQLSNVRGLIEWGGTLLVCAIVFVETGMFVGFFLPGDSLLVTAGVFAGAGRLHIAELLSLVTLCAIAGDQLGYWIGRKAGERLYERRDSTFFKRRHLERAHEFYKEYGGKTIIMARFVPIIRTFCPPVAGAAKMRYVRYLSYDVAGGILWVWSMILLGFTLGKTVPNIDKRIHYVIAGVIVASFIPAVYHAWKAKRPKGAKRPEQPRAVAPKLETNED